MCFSAGASFTAAGLLAVIGSVTISKAEKRFWMVATIPFLFAIQQTLEGFLWLSFVHTRVMLYKSFFIYSFLFFAFLLWPIWIPLSLYWVEQIKWVKNVLLCGLAAGILVAVGLFLNLFFYGALATVSNHHIVYKLHISQLQQIVGMIFYFLATVVSFFVSSIRLGWLFGSVLAASYIFSYYFYYEALVSIWCFFAALLSMLLLMIIT